MQLLWGRRRPAPRAAVAIGVSAILIFPAAAAAASSPAIGQVAFDQRGNLYTEVVHADGTGGALTQLTTDGHSSHAQWSPDGSRLAFERRGDIFTISRSGGSVVRVTQSGNNYQPAWSRTGKQIGYVHVQPNGHGEIYRISATGGNGVRLTHDATTSCGDDHPHWSPVQDTIVYHQSIQSSCLQKPAQWTGNRILMVNVATGTTSVLFRDFEIKGARAATVDNPVFTPDGQHLVIYAQCGTGPCNNWLTAYLVVTLAGTLSEGTYTFPDSDGTAPELLADQAVSPDGKWLVASVAWGQDPINNVLTTYQMGTNENRPGLAAAASQVRIEFHPDWRPVR